MSVSQYLNLPLDIPWKRICVSEDMIDSGVCDDHLPPKWNSSLAIFRYDPPEEYQQHAGYKLSYLKVTATVCGYQPSDKEILGQLDYSRLSTDDIADVDDLLGEYLGCTGAILQVTVAPKSRGLAKAKYPFFLDFEPKSRSLYEMATDTNERASRSLETLSVSKSGGSAQSTEVLDVDMGGSVSLGVQGSAAEIGGGGLNVSQSRQGQWGTKSLNAENEGSLRTVDHSREKREAQSFTTQLTQMYHLFDSYHVGTNRAVFFIQPRPHVVEEPSGFVSGPRPVEGIQEIFMIVARPEDQEDFCVSARLDTAHFAINEVFEHDRRSEPFLCEAKAPAPTRSKDLLGPDSADAKDEPDYHLPLTFLGNDVGERIYKCQSITKEVIRNYAPSFSDYKIDIDNPYEVLEEKTEHGSWTATVASDGGALSVKCVAKSNYCYNWGGDFCVGCPASLRVWDAVARVNLSVKLVSREPIKFVGYENILLVTTRGVCCCEEAGFVPGARVVDVTRIDDLVNRAGDRYGLRVEDLHEAPPRPQEKRGGMKVRAANSLARLISDELRRSVSRPGAYEKAQDFAFTDYFISRLYNKRRMRPGVYAWAQAGVETARGALLGKQAEEYFGHEKVTRRDLLVRSNRRLAEGLGISRSEAAAFRLEALGIRRRESPEDSSAAQ